MYLIAIEIKNITFTCKNCSSTTSIKYITSIKNCCNKCLISENVYKKKERLTPTIIADYEKHSLVDLNYNEKQVMEQINSLKLKK